MKRIVIVFLSIPFLFTACKQDKAQKETIKTVKVSVVSSYGESEKVSFPGKVKAASEINLSFRISGPIAKINVKEGEFVKKGQVLAEMDQRDYKIQYSATEAEYKQVKAEAERIMKLYEKQSVSENDYDKAVSGLQQITAKYNAHKNALADTKLTAPFDGFVNKRFFDKDETINAGMPVFSVISTGAPEIEINIPVSEFIRQDQFHSYTCSFDIYPNKDFPLELISISQKANMNQLYQTRFRLKTPEDFPKPAPGMSTMVTIQYKTDQSNMTSIPLNAVFEKEGKAFVWVYDTTTEKIQGRQIKLIEIQNDGTAIVSEGLMPGESVVSAGVHSLSDDEQVRLLPEVTPTNAGGLL